MTERGYFRNSKYYNVIKYMNLQSSEKNWDHLAREDAMFVILTYKDKRGKKWEREEFFDTGIAEVNSDLGSIKNLGVSLRFGKALDFGCGVGRLTQALADHFDEVHGVDISRAMVDLANTYNRHGSTCTYHASTSNMLAEFPDNYFDFVFSKITLQHIKPIYSTQYIRALSRIVAPGGVLYFQLTSAPSEQHDKKNMRLALKSLLPDRINEWLRDMKYSNVGRVDVFGVPRKEVEDILIASNMAIRDICPDASAGENWQSFTYCAEKRM